MTRLSIGYLAAAAFGALAMEMLTWFQLRERLHQAKYQRMLRSRLYWLFTAGGLGVGIGVAYFWTISEPSPPTPLKVVFVAAAAPSLLKSVAAATSASQATRLGHEDAGDSFSAEDYLFPTAS